MILGLLAVILIARPRLLLALADRAADAARRHAASLGELVQRQAIPRPGERRSARHRRQLKVGNRDLYGLDFRWIDDDEIAERQEPAGLLLVERSEYGH